MRLPPSALTWRSIRPTADRLGWPGGYALAAVLLALYLGWKAFAPLPLDQTATAIALGIPLSLLATYAAWRASRQAAEVPRLRRAWIWIACGLGGLTAAGIVQLAFETNLLERAYPSIADPFYLSFYPFVFFGILGFVSLRPRRDEGLGLALDCAVVGLCGAAAFAYFVFAPTMVEGTSPLEALVTIAYPAGDVVLLAALGAAVMTTPLPCLRVSLAWMTAAMAMFILSALAFSSAVLRDDLDGGALELFYQLGCLCFLIAAGEQRRVSAAEVRGATPAPERARWLPYLAIATAIAILLSEELGDVVARNLAITSILVLVLILVVARQLVSLRALRQSRTRLAEAQELAQLGSWDWNLKDDVIHLTDQEAKLLGVPAGVPMTIEQADAMIEDPDLVESVRERGLAEGLPFSFDVRIVRADGEKRTLLARVDPEIVDGELVAMHGTHQDITDRRLMESQLEYQATHDPLTGLFNRRRFTQELERALRSAGRYGRIGAVLSFDVDNFKLINDMHGHAVGDAALKAVAAAIAERARETDVVARLGGDEFAIVLPEAGIEDARVVAADVREAISRREGPTLSVGIAAFGGGSEQVVADVMVAADVALYEAKQRGKNQVCVYDGRPDRALGWVQQIQAALDEDRLVLYAQPMLDLQTERIGHHELLVRMLSPEGEVIAPGAFLPTAERVGLITEIDRWVTRRGLELARGGGRVSVNLSAPSIGDPQILATVGEAIADGVPAGNLIFEITETAAMTNMGSARGFVAELDRLGCGVALDDFGTGFGSFAYLKQLPTSYLKIDTEFVRDLLSNATDREVVRSITQVAHSLGKRTVAEGVEDAETLEALRRYGVDCAQGYFIGRPQPVSDPGPQSRDARLHIVS